MAVGDTHAINNAAGQPQTVRGLVKPLAGGTLVEHLKRVLRGAPDSTLP